MHLILVETVHANCKKSDYYDVVGNAITNCNTP